MTDCAVVKRPRVTGSAVIPLPGTIAIAIVAITIAMAVVLLATPAWPVGVGGLVSAVGGAASMRWATRRPRTARALALDPTLDLVVDELGRLREAGPRIRHELGWSRSELAAMAIGELVHPDDLDRLLDGFRSIRTVDRAEVSISVRCRTPHAWRPVDIRIVNAVANRRVRGYGVAVRDATSSASARGLAANRAAQVLSLAGIAGRSLAGVEEGTLIQSALGDMQDVLRVDVVEYHTLHDGGLAMRAGVGAGGVALDRETAGNGGELARRSLAAGRPVLERRSPHDDAAYGLAVPLDVGDAGRAAVVLRSMAPRSFDDAVVAYVHAATVVMALAHRQRGAEQDAFRRTRTDQLTGLVNRDVFRERLRAAVGHAAREGQTLAVLLIDLDHFKIVNDSLGHAAGDVLIEAISRRLTDRLRPGDTLARFGGDEFVVLSKGLASSTQAMAAARRLQARLAEPFQVAGHEVRVTASVGVAICSADGGDCDELLQQADAALNRAKELGRDRVERFEPSMQEQAVTRLRTEQELRAALADDQLRLFYQPVVDLETGRTTALEALVRWVHPRRGLVSPQDFIPISEATGLIEEIGAWVVNEACRQARSWVDAGNPTTVTINLSGRELGHAGLLDTVERALERHELDAALLSIDLTESVILDDVGAAAETIGALRSRGVTIAIDDFGTGHTSLSYLTRLPVDAVKIDRSFVADIDRSGDAYKVLAALVNLAKDLGKRVVAEGVERESQLDLLRELGCDEAQGFLFSPAVFDIDHGTATERPAGIQASPPVH